MTVPSKVPAPIYSESPLAEQWRILLRYTLSPTIKSHFLVHHKVPPQAKMEARIASSISQAHEYFTSAATSSLHIAPLLLYYGASNLLVATSLLIAGHDIDINHHGMLVRYAQASPQPSDISIDMTASPRGSISVLTPILDPLEVYGDFRSFSLVHLLASIPDLHRDIALCFPSLPPAVIPTETVKKGPILFERIALIDLERFPDVRLPLSLIKRLKAAYLVPQGGTDHLILRRRLDWTDICWHSLSGQRFFPLALHTGNKHVRPCPETTILMALFALAFTCRYRADLWYPFVRSDTSGEKYAIESFVRLIHRLLPALCIDRLAGRQVFFSAAPYRPTEEPPLTEDRVRALVADLIDKHMQRERVS